MEKALENTVRKEENAGNQHFPTVFSALSKREIVILATFNLSSASAFNLVMSKLNGIYMIMPPSMKWGYIALQMFVGR